jgi:hypothetical protein
MEFGIFRVQRKQRMRRELNDSEKQGRVDCRSALRLGERQPSPRQLVVPGGMEVMGLYDPTHEAWPRCPHDGKMLQPLESWYPRILMTRFRGYAPIHYAITQNIIVRRELG